MGGINEKAKKAVFWDFIGALITRSGYFIFSIFLARLLTPEDFGVIGMVLVFTGFAQAIVDMGFSTAIIQAKQIDNIQLSTVFFINFLISFFLTLILFLMAPWVADFYKVDLIKPITQAVSFIFIINSLNSVQLALLRRDLKFKIIAQASFISTIVGGIVAVAVALYGLGVWSLVLQALMMAVVNVIAIWWRSGWKPHFTIDFKSVRGLWNFGGFMFLDSIFANVYARIDVFFVGKIFNPGILGLYLRSKSINNFVVEFSSQSISKVLFPAVSRVQDDPGLVRQYLIRALDVTGLITFFLLGWMFLTASESIILLFGEKWRGSIIYYQWLALIGYGFPIGSILISTLRGQGHSKLYFLRSLLIYSNSVPAYLLGYFYGIDAFLKALVVTTFIGVMINIYFSKITTGMSFIKHMCHALYFTPVTMVSVLLVFLLARNIDFNNLYIAFAYKSVFFVMFYGGFAFLLRKKLLMSIINIRKIFRAKT